VFTLASQSIRYRGTSILHCPPRVMEFESIESLAAFLEHKKPRTVRFWEALIYVCDNVRLGNGEIETQVFSVGGGLDRKQLIRLAQYLMLAEDIVKMHGTGVEPVCYEL
jgi:hypothetical protein